MPFKKIAVVAGADEVFVDDVVRMAKTLEVSERSLRIRLANKAQHADRFREQTVRPSTQVMVAKDEPHDAPVIDQIFKTASGASTDFSTKFILSCCEKP